MKTTFTLATALHQAGSELERELPPPELRARVQAAVAARLADAPARGKHGAGRPWAWSGAMACAAVALGSVVLMLSNPQLQPTAPLARMSAFMPVVPQDQWPAEDAPAWLVSTELRRDRLAALGLPYDPARAGESVRAELLMRASGEVLAVRFLQ